MTDRLAGGHRVCEAVRRAVRLGELDLLVFYACIFGFMSVLVALSLGASSFFVSYGMPFSIINYFVSRELVLVHTRLHNLVYIYIYIYIHIYT